MSNLGLIIGLLVLLLNSTSRAVAVADDYSRNDFPPSFIFGSGTTAYQVIFTFLNKYEQIVFISG